MKKYTADFETTTNPKDVRVWAWGVCDIDNFDDFQYDNNIDSFMEWCKKHNGSNVYFHNLRFDGCFIISWLLEQGYIYSDEKKSKTFNSIISVDGEFYKIEVIFDSWGTKKRKITFYDSLKKLPFPVKKIAEDFELPIKKGEINYTLEREKGHILTSDELSYLKNDVQIMAMALKMQFDEGMTKMTIGSDCLSTFKKMNKDFKYLFPELPIEVDSDIRLAYRGGWTYTSKVFQGLDVGCGQVYDINSMYPYALRTFPMPYGIPIFFEGRYEQDELYPLYIQKIKVELKIKENHVPTIQIKKNPFYVPTEYIEETLGEPIVLYMTNIDMEVMFEQYDILYIEYINGWKFKQIEGAFNEYIDFFMEIKKNSTGAKRLLAKLFLNNLYGKFATNPRVTKKIPYLDENGILNFKLGEEETGKTIYTAVGVFTTSYCRRYIQRTAQSVYERFLYADTDSIHILGKEIPNINIHDKNLGAFKLESEFERARFLRAKTYIETHTKKTYFDYNGKSYVLSREKIEVKCAGMTDAQKEEVTWENFQRGLTLGGKLMPVKYRGGVVLEEFDYTIK